MNPNNTRYIDNSSAPKIASPPIMFADGLLPHVIHGKFQFSRTSPAHTVFMVFTRKSETLSPSPITTNGKRCDASHDTATIECRSISERIIIMQFRD